jgi:hypothetical protein
MDYSEYTDSTRNRRAKKCLVMRGLVFTAEAQRGGEENAEKRKTYVFGFLWASSSATLCASAVKTRSRTAPHLLIGRPGPVLKPEPSFARRRLWRQERGVAERSRVTKYRSFVSNGLGAA